MKNIILCLINVIGIVMGQLLFKYGSKGYKINSVMDMIKVFFSPVIILALVVYVLCTVLWIYILNKMPISTAYPMQALAFPLVLLLSMYLFKENIPINRWVGVIIIVSGVIITTR